MTKWILTLPLPKYQRGPRPLQPLLSRGSWLPPLITRGGSAPFQSLPVQGIWTSPSNHQRGLRPLPAPSCPGRSLISPPPSLIRGGSAPLQPLPVQGSLISPPPTHQRSPPLPTPFLPLIYQAWPLESQSTEKLSTRMDLERRLAASLSPWMMYVNYSCLILGNCA